ncbi:MAG: DUF433 domain-containing protein [Gammaproteobacteria bacterium]|nr:MAG: DUF433 domain-containing protein [Gammaproteobacteria bacterium]TLY99365.1 MAG: DUF433 domain-containing protein [Gammaproteobacteria bacterium]
MFLGTRVPVQTLLNCLQAGDTLDDFLAGFPTLTRAHVACTGTACRGTQAVKTYSVVPCRNDHASDL